MDEDDEMCFGVRTELCRSRIGLPDSGGLPGTNDGGSDAHPSPDRRIQPHRCHCRAGCTVRGRGAGATPRDRRVRAEVTHAQHATTRSTIWRTATRRTSRGCGASRRRTRTIPPTAAWSGTRGIVSVLRDLWGRDIRFDTAKLNMKSAGFGAAGGVAPGLGVLPAHQ